MSDNRPSFTVYCTCCVNQYNVWSMFAEEISTVWVQGGRSAA